MSSLSFVAAEETSERLCEPENFRLSFPQLNFSPESVVKGQVLIFSAHLILKTQFIHKIRFHIHVKYL